MFQTANSCLRPGRRQTASLVTEKDLGYDSCLKKSIAIKKMKVVMMILNLQHSTFILLTSLFFSVMNHESSDGFLL